jgi:CheY-like chemotaxis protein
VGLILILEPHPEVSQLFGQVALRLGHTSVTEVSPDASVAPVDAIVVEPTGKRGRALARLLHERFPDIPVICASTLPPTPEIRADLEPRAYLTKPFMLADLEQALAAALEPAGPSGA